MPIEISAPNNPGTHAITKFLLVNKWYSVRTRIRQIVHPNTRICYPAVNVYPVIPYSWFLMVDQSLNLYASTTMLLLVTIFFIYTAFSYARLSFTHKAQMCTHLNGADFSSAAEHCCAWGTCSLGWSEKTKMWSFEKQQQPKVAKW